MHDLGRGLLRRTSVAGGLAALAPVAMILAAVVAGLGGGAGRLDGLTEALTGPPEVAPAAVASPGARDARVRDPARLLSALDSAPAAAPRASSGDRRPAGAGDRSPTPAAGGGGSTPSPAVPSPVSSPPGAASPPSSPPSPAPSAPAQPPDPAPPPGPVRQVTDEVQAIVEPVPVVGPPVVQVVDTLQDAIEPTP